MFGPARFLYVIPIFCFCLSLPSLSTAQQSSSPDVFLILRLEKPRYLLGESIRFWLGVSGTVIPAELRKPCRLEINRPDGTTKNDVVDWPVDGDPSRGWSGGWGFNADQAGSYGLVFECVGKKTAALTLVVEKNEISDQIKATFRFDTAVDIRQGSPVPVIFSVTNGSKYTIRFPRRGAMMEGISVSVARKDPAFRSDFFYPWEKLTKSDVSPETYGWAYLDNVPSITLKPGEHFEQRLALQETYKFEQPGDYLVTFSSAVSTLVGEKDGDLAELCPIRLVAQATQNLRVSSGSR